MEGLIEKEEKKKMIDNYLLVEYWLRLTTVTRLLTVVTTLSLRKEGVLALLVLRYFMRSMESNQPPFQTNCLTVYIRVLPAGLALAVCGWCGF